MRDYRTWWRKKIDESEILEKMLSELPKTIASADEHCFCCSCLFEDFWNDVDIDQEHEDCMLEQLWAIYNGLAD